MPSASLKVPNFFGWKVLDKFAAQDMAMPAKLTLFIYFFTSGLLLCYFFGYFVVMRG